MHTSKSKRCFNEKSSTYYFYMKTKMLQDFQMWISAPLVSISLHSQIMRLQGIQTDFFTFGTKPEFIKIV